MSLECGGAYLQIPAFRRLKQNYLKFQGSLGLKAITRIRVGDCVWNMNHKSLKAKAAGVAGQGVGCEFKTSLGYIV